MADEQYDVHSINLANIDDAREKLKRSIFVDEARDKNWEFDSLDDRCHFGYFCNYLFNKDGIRIQTIVVENYYISGTYITDYANYYSKASYQYKRNCRRIHFFSEKLIGKNAKTQFRNLLMTKMPNENAEIFFRSYKGHIVIRPVPDGIFGASLLAHYNTELQEGDVVYNRKFTAIKKYRVNLFGKKLQVDTMPFHEQDHVSSRCGATALWFALQVTADIFDSKRPSPSEIGALTQNDYNFRNGPNPFQLILGVQAVSNILNNCGLTCDLVKVHIESADVSRLNLESTISPESRISLTKQMLFAYLRGGIPVMLAIDINSQGDFHLITLNGYRVKPANAYTCAGNCIDRFYGHDDQVGPFSRVVFVSDLDENEKREGDHNFDIVTAWPDKNQTTYLDETGDKRRANINHIIVPLSAKIQLKFFEVNKIVESFDLFFNHISIQAQIVSPCFQWEVFLTKSSKYKEELLNELKELDMSEFSVSIFFDNLPKYIWVAKLYTNNTRFSKSRLLGDIIIDPTDSHESNCIHSVNTYSKALRDFRMKHCTTKNIELLTNSTHEFNFKNIIQYLNKF